MSKAEVFFCELDMSHMYKLVHNSARQVYNGLKTMFSRPIYHSPYY